MKGSASTYTQPILDGPATAELRPGKKASSLCTIERPYLMGRVPGLVLVVRKRHDEILSVVLSVCAVTIVSERLTNVMRCDIKDQTVLRAGSHCLIPCTIDNTAMGTQPVERGNGLIASFSELSIHGRLGVIPNEWEINRHYTKLDHFLHRFENVHVTGHQQHACTRLGDFSHGYEVTGCVTCQRVPVSTVCNRCVTLT